MPHFGHLWPDLKSHLKEQEDYLDDMEYEIEQLLYERGAKHIKKFNSSIDKVVRHIAEEDYNKMTSYMDIKEMSFYGLPDISPSSLKNKKPIILRESILLFQIHLKWFRD